MLIWKSSGSLKVKINTSLVSAGEYLSQSSCHLEALLYHSHLIQLLKVILQQGLSFLNITLNPET